jgi:hypothetical protein
MIRISSVEMNRPAYTLRRALFHLDLDYCCGRIDWEEFSDAHATLRDALRRMHPAARQERLDYGTP